jgi:transposase InsO family protein
VKDDASPSEARHELSDSLRFSNEQRIHQALDYQTPAEVYFARRLDNRTPLQGEG